MGGRGETSVERGWPGAVRTAQRGGRARRRRTARRGGGKDLAAPVPADVVRRVQAPRLVAGDEHGLAGDVDHDDPRRNAQSEGVATADAEPLAEQDGVALDPPGGLVDVHLPGERLLHAGLLSWSA